MRGFDTATCRCVSSGDQAGLGLPEDGVQWGKENGSFRDVPPGCSLRKESAEETITCESL